MGLIQRVLEEEGIATVGISVERKFTEEVRPPRTMFLRWPYGHAVGEPGNVEQQRFIVKKALELLETMQTPGEIVAPPYRWRRVDYLDDSKT